MSLPLAPEERAADGEAGAQDLARVVGALRAWHEAAAVAATEEAAEGYPIATLANADLSFHKKQSDKQKWRTFSSNDSGCC